MALNDWDTEITPPKGGYQKLQTKIQARETERIQLRLTLATILIVIVHFFPPNQTFQWPWRYSNAHREIMAQFERKWKEKNHLSPILKVGESANLVHYQVIISKSDEEK